MQPVETERMDRNGNAAVRGSSQTKADSRAREPRALTLQLDVCKSGESLSNSVMDGGKLIVATVQIAI